MIEHFHHSKLSSLKEVIDLIFRMHDIQHLSFTEITRLASVKVEEQWATRILHAVSLETIAKKMDCSSGWISSSVGKEQSQKVGCSAYFKRHQKLMMNLISYLECSVKIKVVENFKRKSLENLHSTRIFRWENNHALSHLLLSSLSLSLFRWKFFETKVSFL